MAIDERNAISIAIDVFYAPALLLAVFLCTRLGFRRSDGWLFLVIFSLARIIGASMELATINDPTNISLYIGSAVLQGIGLSPLLLATMGLLNRFPVIPSDGEIVRLAKNVLLRLVGLLMIAALVLGSYGGSKSYNNGVYKVSIYTKVSSALYIVAFILIVGITFLLSSHLLRNGTQGKRVLLAVAISLPVLLVRMVYNILSVFVSGSKFSLFSGDPTIFLCIAVIEEMFVVGLYELVGLTLTKVPKSAVDIEAQDKRNSSGTVLQRLLRN